MVGTVGAIEAGVGLFMAVALTMGVYHKYVVDPAIQEAGDAMATARNAKQQADAAEDTAEEAVDRVDEKLDRIDDSLDSIQESLQAQAREARGRTFQLYQLTKTIRETDAIDPSDVPDVNEDDFLRSERPENRGGDD